MNDVEYTIDVIKNHPYVIAQDVGFKDVKLFPHNEWMHEMLTGTTDYTLLAHRGSFKSSVFILFHSSLNISRTYVSNLFVME